MNKTLIKLTKLKGSPLLKGDSFLFLAHHHLKLLITSPLSYIVWGESIKDPTELLKITNQNLSWENYTLEYLENILTPCWID